MKKSIFSKFISVVAVAIVSVFFLTGCAEDPANNSGSGGGGDNNGGSSNPNNNSGSGGNNNGGGGGNSNGGGSNNNLAAKLQAIKENAVSNTEYHLELTSNEAIEAQTLSYSGKSNITIRLTASGGEKTISLIGRGTLFTISDDVTLILESGVTLRGSGSNDNPLVGVAGTLVMNNGAKISGNGAAGVSIYSGATFTMTGGEISGNTRGVYMWYGTFTMTGGKISGNTAIDNGGGVYALGGTFTMEGGEISGNTTASGKGGGVYNGNGNIFTMTGGEISSNTASNNNGGGVHCSGGGFTMENGKISGNTARRNGGGVYILSNNFKIISGEISDNIAVENGGGVYYNGNYDFTIISGKISGNTATNNGGGVYNEYGAFTMIGGEISGNTASKGGGVYHDRYSFIKTGGTIYGYENESISNRNTATEELGHAVYIESDKFRGTTAEPGINLDSGRNGADGGWEN